jgi:hypothetical protein
MQNIITLENFNTVQLAFNIRPIVEIPIHQGEIFPNPISREEIMGDSDNKKAILCLIDVISPKGELIKYQYHY